MKFRGIVWYIQWIPRNRSWVIRNEQVRTSECREFDDEDKWIKSTGLMEFLDISRYSIWAHICNIPEYLRLESRFRDFVRLAIATPNPPFLSASTHWRATHLLKLGLNLHKFLIIERIFPFVLFCLSFYFGFSMQSHVSWIWIFFPSDW